MPNFHFLFLTQTSQICTPNWFLHGLWSVDGMPRWLHNRMFSYLRFTLFSVTINLQGKMGDSIAYVVRCYPVLRKRMSLEVYIPTMHIDGGRDSLKEFKLVWILDSGSQFGGADNGDRVQEGGFNVKFEEMVPFDDRNKVWSGTLSTEREFLCIEEKVDNLESDVAESLIWGE